VNVVALVENAPAPGSGVSGEHGLSVIVRAKERAVLFDTGTTGLLVRNAELLGSGEMLRRLYAVVLSHAHYDHTGGLAAVLRRIGSASREGGTVSLPVFVGPGFFASTVRRTGADREPIGPPLTRLEFEQLGAWFIENRERAQVVPDFFVTGEIPRREEWEGLEQDLCVEHRDGSVVPDPFPEEQALAVRMDGGIAVFVGCAHRGLVNSIAAARRATGEERVRAVFGGAHLRSASRERIERTVEAVARLEPELVVLGHCTGKAAEERFARALGERFRPLRAGASWTLQ
jgi:7,8-dihydropterin-6-yl-methyl-4-(beta-D-ribofuranosyl)aminobenzene 5'-phosphate synthase